MKYKRCTGCDYYVTAGERRCPNCGASEPRSEKPQSETLTMETPMNDGTRAAFGGFIGAVIGGMLMDGMGVAVGVAVGVSLGVLLGSDREWTTPDPFVPLKKAVDTLRQDEETIRKRLQEIEAREQHLAETWNQVEAQTGGSTETWEKVRRAIDQASAILARQKDRYHVKLWEIALVRWTNALEPLAADWDDLTHELCNQRLRQLESLKKRGQQYLSDWDSIDLADLPEASRCMERLKHALTACDKLYEALIVQQAALAVRGIAPVDDMLSAPLAPLEGLSAMDAFNARAALGEFNKAFDELEGEYSRLRSEEELAESAALVRRMG
jgi:hypothetical protein